MSQMIVILVAAWLGLNVAFVAMRLYLTVDDALGADTDFVGYPKLVNSSAPLVLCRLVVGTAISVPPASLPGTTKVFI
jgi:hypothetical protein